MFSGKRSRTGRQPGRFLELTFDASVLTFYRTAASRLDEHQARYAADGTLIISKADRLHNHRVVTQPPRADRIGRWTTELTADECARFESVAGDWLDALGYRRGAERV